jgi:histidine ammonia-lyase
MPRMTDTAHAPLEVGQPFEITDVVSVARDGRRAILGPTGRAALTRAAAAVHARLVQDAPATYGINTGFGALAEVRVSDEQLVQLQLNLIRSHAVGVGELVPTEAVRAMMLLRAQVLALGWSGVRPLVVEAILDLLNARVHPLIPALGSVGACGDLAPLAHLALVLIGEGRAEFEGQVLSGAEALRRAKLTPIVPAPKEGLSLINGTASMTAIGALAFDAAHNLLEAADVAGAMTVEAIKGSTAPFDPAIVDARPHPGARVTSDNLRALLADSVINASHADCDEVQDAYSVRCMPQVHGSARDLVTFASRMVGIELNAATDNPLVFPDGRIVSNGNFHGQPVAAACDVGVMALADLASISERRIAYLIDPARSRGLPAFLAAEPGLGSGFMMAQVTAAALVSELKNLANPRSVDSIPTSADKEDHVSMGMMAARALARAADLCGWVLAIELAVAARGIELRGLPPGRGVAAALARVRSEVETLATDREMHADFETLKAAILKGAFTSAHFLGI